MDTIFQPTDRQIDKFWSKYDQIAQLFRIPKKIIPWYRKHVQSFISDFPDIRLQEQNPENITAWLENLGRNGMLEEWHYQPSGTFVRINTGLPIR